MEGYGTGRRLRRSRRTRTGRGGGTRKIIGTTFFRMGGVAAYSPAFPRGGDGANFTVQVFDLNDSPSFIITIQHKNVAETTWDDVDSFATIMAARVVSKRVSGLKEMVRFKYVISPSCSLKGVSFLMGPRVRGCSARGVCS